MSNSNEEEFLNIMKHNGMEFLSSQPLVAMNIAEIVDGMAAVSESLMYISDFLNASAQAHSAINRGEPSWQPAMTEEQIVVIRELINTAKAFNTIITNEYEEDDGEDEEEDEEEDDED